MTVSANWFRVSHLGPTFHPRTPHHRPGVHVSRAEPLQSTLEVLDYSGSEGLVTRDERPDVPARGVLWNELVDKCDVDAAYFRGPVPLVAFAEVQDERESREVQSRLWNLSRVPILITTSSEQIAAYSCFVPPPTTSDHYRARMVGTRDAGNVGQVLADFSRINVEAGRAAKAYPDHFKRRGRVDAQLLSSLRSLRRQLAAKNDPGEVDAFIGRSILVRYLEDRGVLTPEHFQELVSFDNFFDVLMGGKAATRDLFLRLGERFNGDIFGSDESELLNLSRSNLSTVAAFFRGADIESGQERLWPFDFSIIPSELVSSIYEQLLEESQKVDAAYYTPRHVVGLILDEVLPWDGEGFPVILDPACGSGIFLSEAFRRLAFRERRARGDGKPDFRTLSGLLKRSIFGVDQNRSAIGVTAFGLYLALLEQFDPPTIWRESRLPHLTGSNLIVSDFFSTEWSSDGDFDLIIGNPPWKSRMTPSARRFAQDRELDIPDRQIALAFLWRAAELVAESGALALLMPAKPLLHNKSGPAIRLRRQLFESLPVETVIDVSPLRRVVFNAAVAPSAVIVVRGGAPASPEPVTTDEILHVALRDSPLQSTIDGFVVSQEDVHVLNRRQAVVSPDVWKTLLWGDPGDLELIQNVRGRFRSVEEIAKSRGWVHGQGFQIDGGDENDASHLLGLRFIPTQSVEQFAITGPKEAVTDSVMHRPRNPELFRGPHLLVRRGLVGGRSVAALVRGDAAFNNGLFGIAARRTDLSQLRLLEACINSSFGQYFQFMTSSSWGVERDFVEANEYLALPLPEEHGPAWDRIFSLVESPPKRKGSRIEWMERLDEAVYDAYGLTEVERLRVADALRVRLDMFREGSKSVAFTDPDELQLESYLSGLREALDASLRSVGTAVSISQPSTAYLVATVAIRDGDSPTLGPSNATDVFERLVARAESTANDWPLPATVVMPVLVVADGREVHLIKPGEVRYWTRTVGHEDAAHAVAAMLAADTQSAQVG